MWATVLINVTTQLTEVSSCYRASFELSPAGICWLRYPSSSYCSSSNLLTQNIFNLELFTKTTVRTSGSDQKFLKKAVSDIWRLGLQLMFFWLLFQSPRWQPQMTCLIRKQEHSKTQRYSLNTVKANPHIREAETGEYLAFLLVKLYYYNIVFLADQLVDWSTNPFSTMTPLQLLPLLFNLGRDFRSLNVQHFKIKAVFSVIVEKWTRVTWGSLMNRLISQARVTHLSQKTIQHYGNCSFGSVSSIVLLCILVLFFANMLSLYSRAAAMSWK